MMTKNYVKSKKMIEALTQRLTKYLGKVSIKEIAESLSDSEKEVK